MNIEIPKVSEIKCALSQPKEATKIKRVKNIMSEKGVNQGSILPAAQCAPNSFVNRFIDLHASMRSAWLQTYLLHISLYEFFLANVKTSFCAHNHSH